MLDDGTLALRDEPLAVALVLKGQCLVGGMSPTEIDKSNDIKVHIELLKCLLRILVDSPAAAHEVITLQAKLLSVLSGISPVDVAPELVLWIVRRRCSAAEH